MNLGEKRENASGRQHLSADIFDLNHWKQYLERKSSTVTLLTLLDVNKFDLSFKIKAWQSNIKFVQVRDDQALA